MQMSDHKGGWLVGKAVYKCACISQIRRVVGRCVRIYTDMHARRKDVYRCACISQIRRVVGWFVRMYTDMHANLR